MKFLFFTPGYHPDIPGGAWRVASELAVRLAARDHQVDVITNHPGSPFEARETRDGVHLHRVGPEHRQAWWPAHGRRNREASRVARALVGGGADFLPVVGTHHAYFESAVAGLGIPWISVFEGPWAQEHLWSRASSPGNRVRKLVDRWVAREFERRERRLLQGARRIVVISRHFETKLPEWHPVPLPPVTRLHGSVDLGRFAPPTDRNASRKEWGILAEDRVVLTVRRLDPRMGLEILIDAFQMVSERQSRARLWIAGSGPSESGLRARVSEKRMEARVRFLGRVEEHKLPGLYGAVDLTIMPSLDLEGFGLATIESLACGTPVLGSRAAATPEILEPLSPELLFEPGSVQDLAMKLERSLALPDRLPSGDECRAHVERRYGWEPWVETWERWAEEANR